MFRALVFASLGWLLAASSAAADTPRVGPHAPLPRWSVGLAFNGMAASLGPVSVDGVGGTAEVGLAHARWQLFGEASLMRVTAGETLETPGVKGTRDRLGVGVRYLARSLHVDRSGAFEMTLEAGIGFEEYRWSGGGRIRRPDVGFGWSLQVRIFAIPLAVRLGVALAVAPPLDDSGPVARIVCRGECPAAAPRPLDFRFSPVLGVAW
jgi:hypothetical protein